MRNPVEAFTEPSERFFERYGRYVNHEFIRLLDVFDCRRNFVRARGAHLWDERGNRYLDFGAGGTHNMGYNAPQTLRILRKLLAAGIPNFVRNAPEHLPAMLAEELSRCLPGGPRTTVFTNSGSEAVEASIKLAQLATGRRKIIYTRNSYHGATLGAVSVTGKGCVEIPFGDLDALRKALRRGGAAAFITEPVQGVGGVIFPPAGYLEGAQKACAAAGTVFILDEAESGLGRLGETFASVKYGLNPDVVLLARSLSAGIFPMGAAVAAQKVWRKAFGTGKTGRLQTTTMSAFGAGNLASACGLAVLDFLNNTGTLRKVRNLGSVIGAGLAEIKKRHRIIKEVRGKGLLFGIEFDRPVEGVFNSLTLGIVGGFTDEIIANWISSRLLNDYRVITPVCSGRTNVLKIEPPLVVSAGDATRFLDALDRTLESYPSFSKILSRSWKPIMRNIRGTRFSGGAFAIR